MRSVKSSGCSSKRASSHDHAHRRARGKQARSLCERGPRNVARSPAASSYPPRRNRGIATRRAVEVSPSFDCRAYSSRAPIDHTPDWFCPQHHARARRTCAQAVNPPTLLMSLVSGEALRQAMTGAGRWARLHRRCRQDRVRGRTSASLGPLSDHRRWREMGRACEPRRETSFFAKTENVGLQFVCLRHLRGMALQLAAFRSDTRCSAARRECIR